MNQLLVSISQLNHGWFVLHYITLRCVLSALTAFIGTVFFGPWIIRFLSARQVHQTVRDDGPQTHLVKSGTPTMGGVLILMMVCCSTVLWCDLTNPWIQLLSFVLFSFGLVGGVDDYRKIRQRDSQGLSASCKLFFQTILAGCFMLSLYALSKAPVQTQLFLPFFKHAVFDMGWGIIPLGIFAIVGASNAVNLTDGLDGLAIMPVILVAAGLGLFAYLSGHTYFAHYLSLPAVPGVGEVSVFCAALAGAGLGFLWFNAHPAEIFMGDVGALPLGACLGAIAMIVRQEALLVMMGAVFVAEVVSVIIQVSVFKCTGRRVFKMAPLHHHFELSGLSESKVIVRFWIVTLVLVLLSITTLKLR